MTSKTSVSSSAPGKLMLFGEHAVVYGHPCIVTAVDQRVTARISLTDTNTVRIKTPVTTVSLKLSQLTGDHPAEIKFVVAAIAAFFTRYGLQQGLILETGQAFSSQFGFGSSSAVTVAVLHALHQLFGRKVGKRALFDMAYEVVLKVQGVGSGFDLAAAIWGGTLLFVTGGKTIEPLKVGRLPIVCAYTGKKADTVSLVKQVAQLKQNYPDLVAGLFQEIELIVGEAKHSLLTADWHRVADLMNLNQGILEALGVSSPLIHTTSDVLKAKGALGVKLSGAGGGDCVIAVFGSQPPELGEQILKVKLGATGVKEEV